MLRTRESKKNENMPGWPIEDKPVKRQVGMIYWYSWGDYEFDIRVMRRGLGLPSESAEDNWFMAKLADPCGSFCNIMTELMLNLGARAFADVIAEHDRLLDEDAEADRARHIARQKERVKEKDQGVAEADKPIAVAENPMDKAVKDLEDFGCLMREKANQARDTARQARKRNDLKKWDKFNAVARAYEMAWLRSLPLLVQMGHHTSEEFRNRMIPF